MSYKDRLSIGRSVLVKTQILEINLQRLLKRIERSSKIGSTEKGGICRLALTHEDKLFRNEFKEYMLNAGLSVTIDDFGNMYGRREGVRSDLEPILIGSHLDTQPLGGKYDGIYGVLTALEIIETLNDYKIQTEHPIEIVNFTSEEGARFPIPMLGSGGVANVFTQEEIYLTTSSDGKTYISELDNIGYLGFAENRRNNFHSFIELHIEQGPILEAEGIDIGIVKGIQGITWLEVNLTGKSAHAGTTPMDHRKDAFLTASKIRYEIQNIVEDIGNDVKCTIGKLKLYPNTTNCVPEKVDFTVDVRSVDNLVREDAVNRIKSKILSIAAQDNIGILVKEIWDEKTTVFSKALVEQIKHVTNELNLTSKDLYSGAGHDSKYMNLLGETAMIFIPSVDGKSHCEDEYSLDKDIKNGANVLLNLVCKLAKNI